MKRIYELIGVMCFLIASSSPIGSMQNNAFEPLASGGGAGEVGNGIDVSADESAWFLDESRSIKICIEAAPDFGNTPTAQATSFSRELNSLKSSWPSFLSPGFI